MRTFLILVLSFVLAIATPFSRAQPADLPAPATKPVTRTVRIQHIIVRGDLDTARVAREITQHLRDVDESRIDTVVIELDGDRWRTDVLHTIANALRKSTARTCVWLRDSKARRVGAGQAILGLIADECWIEPGMIISRRNDDDRRQFSPKRTDHDALADELMQWAAPRGDRRMDPLLPKLLLGPPTPLWAARDESTRILRLISTEPSAADSEHAILLTPKQADGSLHLALLTPTAIDLGLATGPAAYLINIFEPRNAKPLSAKPVQLEISLEELVLRAGRELETLDREIEAIERDLAAKPRDQRTNTEGFYRDLGRDMLPRLSAATDHLDACEQSLQADPEIARTPPPGASKLTEPDKAPAEWIRAFKKRRTTIARLEKKSRNFAGR